MVCSTVRCSCLGLFLESRDVMISGRRHVPPCTLAPQRRWMRKESVKRPDVSYETSAARMTISSMTTASTPSRSPAPLSRRRRALFTTLYLGLLAGVCLIGLELISRRLFQPQSFGVYPTGEIAFDAQVGWRGRRNLSAAVRHGQYPIPIQLDINPDGFRDGSWDEKLRRATEQHRKKILLLGDSLLYGWANPVDGRLSEQLQARYELTGPPAEVFNTGIP